MTNKETLQDQYKKVFGEEADPALTIAQLEEALKNTPDEKVEDPIDTENPLEQPKPIASHLVQITNKRITKNVTKQQWKNMQQFKHEWKEKVNEPIEVQKLKDNGETKK